MTLDELTEIAEKFLRSEYGLDLDIPIKRNNRLRTVMGRYIEKVDGTPVRIEIAGYLIEYGAQEVIIDVVKHECIHYALSVLDKPYDDGHPYFEEELRKLGVSSTRSNFVGKLYAYSCEECGKEYEDTIALVHRRPALYKTKCCSAKIIVGEERIYNGKEAIH